jgi:hypothetical protein
MRAMRVSSMQGVPNFCERFGAKKRKNRLKIQINPMPVKKRHFQNIRPIGRGRFKKDNPSFLRRYLIQVIYQKAKTQN